MKQQSTRLGKEKIPNLMISLSVPAFIGMFVMALYNIVDTIFVARGVGTLGVAALSIAFPIQMIMTALAATFGIGGASIISRRLGANSLGKAKTSLILSMSRQLLFLIPLVLTLPHLYGVEGIWIAFPIADVLAFLFALLILLKDRKMVFPNLSR